MTVAAPIPIERVPTLGKLTEMEFMVAKLLGCGLSYIQIGLELRIAPATAKTHARNAAPKIPGDLPQQARLTAWARGASRDVLDGRSLWFEVLQRAKRDEGERMATLRGDGVARVAS